MLLKYKDFLWREQFRKDKYIVCWEAPGYPELVTYYKYK